ncbi:MAG: hypothetical protein OEW92_07310 [Gammaproteobacteria bacterium]|jgi:hypothetical protein|nr:hypothetical protein [Gammaproteobacteria bacterium]
MKYLKIFVLTLSVSAIATAAHAGGGKPSLFHCGVQLGGSNTAPKEKPAPKKDRGYGTSQVFKSIDSNAPGVTAYTVLTSSETGRRRMPPVFKIANVGCSWR